MKANVEETMILQLIFTDSAGEELRHDGKEPKCLGLVPCSVTICGTLSKLLDSLASVSSSIKWGQY